MRGVNKVIIIGNLGADPEHRQFDGGGSVTSISVATSEKWKDKNTGEDKEATEWHRISLFNRLGEVAAQYLRKGSKVYIEGSLRTRKYQATDGTDRYATEVRASQMQMLDSKGGDQDGQNYQQPPQQSSQAPSSYAQQQADKAQGMQDQVNQQFAQQNQAKPVSMPSGPVDDDIPFAAYFDGQM